MFGGFGNGMTAQPVAPTAPLERIHLLDVIRGFALLGILLMNIEYFQRPLLAMMQGFNTHQTGLDYATAWVVYVFVQGKFYTMFALLFGMGFVLFLDRTARKTCASPWLFGRRTLALALFGTLHIILIWTGDILLTYAIAGLCLILFRSASARQLFSWSALCILLPVGLYWLAVMGIQATVGAAKASDFVAQHQQLDALIRTGEQVYASGSFSEVLQYRLTELAALYSDGGLIMTVLGILGIMLWGAALARAGIFTRPTEHTQTLLGMLAMGLLIGLPSALYVGSVVLELNTVIPDYTPSYIPSYKDAWVFTVQTLANFGLCFAYMAALALAYTHLKPAQRILTYLAPAGRMALTNYLTHSLVFTWLFYGYGLGLYSEFNRFSTTLMAGALFAIQLGLSHWWLRRYQYGPLEWVWRCATYLRWQPLRR